MGVAVTVGVVVTVGVAVVVGGTVGVAVAVGVGVAVLVGVGVNGTCATSSVAGQFFPPAPPTVLGMTLLGFSSINVDKRRPLCEFKERPAPRRSRYGTFNRRKSNQP